MRLATIRLAVLLLLAVISVPAGLTQSKHDASLNEPPRDGQEWYDRAYKLHNSDRYPEAIEAFKKAIDLGYRKATAMYNIACGYALLNDKENALAWLARAFENGFDGRKLLREDSDLDPLRSDPRFQRFVAGLPVDTERESRRKHKDYAKPDRLVQANTEFSFLESSKSQQGEEWAKVGMKLLLLRDLDRSIVALNRAVDLLGDEGSNSMYNLACAYGLKGDRDAGIKWLERAVNAGFDSPQKLRYDPDINSLRSDSRFPRIEKLSNTLSLSQFDPKHDRDWDSDKQLTNYSRERWAPAIALYEPFVKAEPTSGRGWYNLGFALHYSHEHTRAIEAFKQAIALGYRKAVSTYNVACGYAMLGQRDLAFEWLERAIDAGFHSHGDLAWDRDLDSLRSDPRFARFLESANHRAMLKKKK
ncbi:MAG TPA: hypothetical protein VGW36_09825 [Pyrinomonadaceae bacterium]|nr:hypothetical protein [Pyrinomonadaceae bacterium]